MRQTNNAMTFLASSYRAVFSKAYLKGFASTCALLAISTPYAVAAMEVTPFAEAGEDVGTDTSGSGETTSPVTGQWVDSPGAAQDITITGGYTDDKRAFPHVYANKFTVEGESGSAAVSGANFHLGQLIVGTGAFAKFDATQSFNVSNSLQVDADGNADINATTSITINGELISDGTTKITAGEALSIDKITTNGYSQFKANSLNIDGPIDLNGVSLFDIQTTAKINGPLAVAGHATIAAKETTITGDLVIDGTNANTEVMPNYTDGVVFKTVSGTDATADVFVTGDISLTNSSLQVLGSDNYHAQLLGKENNPSSPIRSKLTSTSGSITVDRGSLNVNEAQITDSTIKVGGKAPYNGNANTADVYTNYSNFYVGMGEPTGGAGGSATLSNTTVNITHQGLLGAAGHITLDSGSHITFNGTGVQSTPGNLDRVHGEIAAKAILRAQTAQLLSGSTATVSNNANGGILAESFSLEGDNSAINVAQGGQLNISGRNSYASIKPGSLSGSMTNTTYEDGYFLLGSGASINNNGGTVVLGAVSSTIDASAGKVTKLDLAKYLFTQNGGTFTNAGTLQIGETLSAEEQALLSSMQNPPAYDEAPGTTYKGISGDLANNSGSKIDVNTGSSLLLQGTNLINNGDINVHSGAEFSITAGSKLTSGSTGSINIASGANVTIRIDALDTYQSNESAETSGTFIDTGKISSLGKFSNSGTITLDKVNENKAIYLATQKELSDVLGASIASNNTSTSTRVILAADTHLRLDDSSLNSGGSIGFSTNSLAQFSGGAGSSLQVNGTIDYTTTASGATGTATPEDFNGLSLVAKSFNFISGKNDASGKEDPILISGSDTSKPIFVATNNVTSNGFTNPDKAALQFTNAELHLDGSALDLGTTSTSGSGDTADNGETLAQTPVSGSVDVDLTFDSGSKFVVDDSLWTAKNLTFNSGAGFELNGSLQETLSTPDASGSYMSLADAAKLQGLTAETLTINSGATATITDGVLTVNQLINSGGEFMADSSYIKVNGDGSGNTVDFTGGMGTKLKNTFIDLNKGSDTIGLAFSNNQFTTGTGFSKFQGEAVEVALNVEDILPSGSVSGSGSSTIDLDTLNGLFSQLVSGSGLLHLTGTENIDVNFGDALNSGSNPWEIDFGKLTSGGSLDMDFSTETTRKSVLINLSGDVTGGWAAVQLASGQAGPVEVKENGTLSLHGATASGNLAQYADGKVAGVNLNSGSTLMLHSSGNIGDITGSSGSLLSLSNTANVNVQAVGTGTGQTVSNGDVSVDKLISAGTLKANQVTANSAEFTQGSKFNVIGMTIANNLTAVGTNINADTMSVGNANFNGSQLTINKDFTASGSLVFDSGSNISVDGTLTAGQGLQLVGNSFMDVGRLIAQSGDIQVGAESGATLQSSSANLVAEHIDLGGGNSLILDPEFGQATATVFAQNIGEIATSASGSGTGTTTALSSTMNLNGNIIVGRNSALGLGGYEKEFRDALAKQQVNGSLTPDGTGAYLHVNRANIQLNDYRLILGAEDIESLKDRVSGTASIHFGEAATMQITSRALSEVASGSSVFTGLDASKSISSTDGRLILPAAVTKEEMGKLFGTEVQLETGSSIVVTTENGLYTGVINDSDDLHGSGDFDYEISDNARNILANLSNPTFDFVTKVLSDGTTHYATIEDYLAGSSSGGDTGGDSGGDTGGDTGTDQSGGSTDTSGAAIAAATGTTVPNGISVIDNSTGYNFIREAVGSVNSSAIEQSARLASLGGIMQVAMQTSQATTSAINGRLGGGHDNAQNGLLPPGKVGRVWATPIYKNYQSSDFSADGLSYGADVNMYGAIMGGELSVARGITTGATFSIGRGSSDGTGVGGGISNDFNYYGFGAYANLRMTKTLDILADVSYTNVANEFEANTGVTGYNKLETSTDADVWSFGITAQYKYRNHSNMTIMPHIGLRYDHIETDGYNVKVDNTFLAHTSSSSANVVSIPVGISMYKDMRSGNWLLRPSADFQLTANLGNSDAETDTTFDGIYGSGIHYKTEFIDPLVYSANFGITASKQYFSIGANIGYTGSANTSEFAVGANARYRF